MPQNDANGVGFQSIERIVGVHQITVINRVKQVGELRPKAYDLESIH